MMKIKRTAFVLLLALLMSACQHSSNSTITSHKSYCLNGQLYNSYQLTVITGSGKSYIAKEWVEEQSGHCDSDSIVLKTPRIKKPLEDEVGSICICGFNTYYECDAGGGLHCISECYDSETYEYCGYDDQYCGEC